MAIWPVGLPQKFLQQGYTEQDAPQVISVTYDVGEPQTRPRSQYRGRKISGSMRMTATELATFNTFFNVTTISGTQPFEFSDPLTGLTINVKFDSEQTPSKGNFNGKYFTLSMTLIEQP